MVWPLIAMAGLQAVQGLSNGYAAGADADRQTRTNQANAAAANLVRGSRNTLTIARGRLARQNQAENNNRTLQHGGQQREAATLNYRRMRDGAISSDFESQIQMAEQAGASVAAQAFHGVSGSVVDVVNGTTRLRNARIQQAQADRMKSADYDASQEQANIQRATIQSLDSSSIMDELDYNVDVAQTITRQGNLFTDLAPAAMTAMSAWGSPSNTAAGTANKFSYANPTNQQIMIR